jgi:putative transposase
MIVVHKIALEPNNRQRTLLYKSAGTARFSYNWALAMWKNEYQSGKSPTEAGLRKHLNSIKRSEFPWMYEVSKNAPQQAVKNLGIAFDRFFSGLGKYPRFKKKDQEESFRADNGPPGKGEHAVKVSDKQIRLPVIGKIKMREKVRFDGQVKSVVVSLKAGRWSASISVEVNQVVVNKAKNQGPVGVDLGIKTLATLSTGESLESPRPYRRMAKILKRRQRRLSRKAKNSNNRRKAVRRIQKVHARIANIRENTLHQLTHRLVSLHETIVIEDLNVKGMLKNRKLAKSISDMGFHEFRRQLTYKVKQRGGSLLLANMWFPSSKLCSDCGWKNKELRLSDRKWSCGNCQQEHDRDINAAINLKNLAGSSSVSACGEASSGKIVRVLVKLASAKQEPNIKPLVET